MVNVIKTGKLASVFRGTCKRHANHDCILCFYEPIERAAIMEYDAHSKRVQAELDASSDLLRRYKGNEN